MNVESTFNFVFKPGIFGSINLTLDSDWSADNRSLRNLLCYVSPTWPDERRLFHPFITGSLYFKTYLSRYPFTLHIKHRSDKASLLTQVAGDISPFSCLFLTFSIVTIVPDWIIRTDSIFLYVCFWNRWCVVLFCVIIIYYFYQRIGVVNCRLYSIV